MPDEEYKPSKLHEMLLTLNWTDIFTTNYDTLLERTRERVFHKRYQLVLNKDDLVYSKCPRIIKLHGSFPSTRPFVVTEEDYRRYPKESAIFVNTVQQSLIENVMCMIGFSGEDPNFLNWIGWIRDNLGESTASKIYLVGVFDIRETERKLFQSRNIVIVNMKDCPGINSGDHKKGIQLFFKKLLELQTEEEKKVWESVNSKSVTEMGYVDKTIRYLKNNLNDVRMQIGEDIDYHSYSTETYYMTLLEYLEKYQSYLTAYQGQEDSDRNQDYSHFRMLWGYECNPQFENDYLMQSLISVDNEKCSLIPDVDPQKYFNFLDHIGMTFRSSYLVKHVEKLPVLVRGMIAVNPYRAFISKLLCGNAVCSASGTYRFL